MNKAEIRQFIRARGNFFMRNDTAESREKLAGIFLRQVSFLTAFQHAKKPFIYLSTGAEAPTDAIIAACFAKKIAVAVPRIDGAEMTPRLIVNRENLRTGEFGILTPPDDAPACAPNDTDCIVAPGVAFDFHCNRVGHGRGFYDRFFAGISPEIPRIGLAFDGQIFPSVPFENFDFPLHFVVTPTRIFAR